MKKAKLSEVVALSGVSASTVSRVLCNRPGISEAKRKLVIDAVAKCGYEPNKRLQKFFKRVHSRQFTILFLVPKTYSATNYPEQQFFSRMLWPLESTLGENKCAMIVSSLETSLLRDGNAYAVAEGVADGVIALCKDSAKILELSKHTPVVLFNSEDRMSNVDIVVPDVERAAFRQIEYLDNMGHRRIVCYRERQSADQPWPDWQEQRFWQAYEKYMRMRKLPFLPSYLDPITMTPETNEEVATQFVRKHFMGAKRPTAILTADVYAGYLIRALSKLGLNVPKDVSIMGFDDDTHGHQSLLPLSTYRQDFPAMAKVAVNLLLERLRGTREAVRVVQVDGEIIHRASVGPAIVDNSEAKIEANIDPPKLS